MSYYFVISIDLCKSTELKRSDEEWERRLKLFNELAVEIFCTLGGVPLDYSFCQFRLLKRLGDEVILYFEAKHKFDLVRCFETVVSGRVLLINRLNISKSQHVGKVEGRSQVKVTCWNCLTADGNDGDRNASLDIELPYESFD